MTELDARSATRITQDWATAFPHFAVYRPLRLLRRLGPLVQGVTLERSSSGNDYLPTAHVHALTRSFPVISLTLAERLLGDSGVEQRIRVSDHESSFAWAVDRLREQSHLSLDRAPSLGDILARYRDVILSSQTMGVPSGFIELEDLVLLPAVLGMSAEVGRGIDLAREVSSRWSTSPHGWPSIAIWVQHLEDDARSVGTLKTRVSEEAEKHKLLALPSPWSDDGNVVEDSDPA
jgi:hypothetical protein